MWRCLVIFRTVVLEWLWLSWCITRCRGMGPHRNFGRRSLDGESSIFRSLAPARQVCHSSGLRLVDVRMLPSPSALHGCSSLGAVSRACLHLGSMCHLSQRRCAVPGQTLRRSALAGRSVFDASQVRGVALATHYTRTECIDHGGSYRGSRERHAAPHKHMFGQRLNCQWSVSCHRYVLPHDTVAQAHAFSFPWRWASPGGLGAVAPDLPLG